MAESGKLMRSQFKLAVGSGTLPHCRRRYRDDGSRCEPHWHCDHRTAQL